MHTADLAAHRADRRRRDRRRLAEAIRQVALHASAEDHVELEKIVVLFDADQLTADDALERVAIARRQQHRAA